VLHLPYEIFTLVALLIGFFAVLCGWVNLAILCGSAAVAFAILETGYRMVE
jgi:divalent metal cation (Fe/Co/Zn/Cd) transporter